MSEPATEPTEPTDETPPDDDEEEEAAEPTPDGEPEPSPEPPTAPQGLSEKEMEKMLRALDAEAQRHSQRVQAIMGDEYAMLVPCPLDFTPGYTFDPSTGLLPEHIRTGALLFLGQQAEPEFEADPDKHECEVCHGLGKLRTGSKVPNQEALPCIACNGQGWKGKVVAVAFPQAVPSVPTYVPPSPLPLASGELLDQWGRPATHPHYNIPPAAIGA